MSADAPERLPADTTLWARARSGDADAFGMLFDRHAQAIYNYCFRRTGNSTIAEDLLSIVFLEAWRRRDKGLEPGKVLPWLYGIATNVIRNERRSQRRYAAALRRLPANPFEPSFTESVDDRLDDQRQMQELLGYVTQLPRGEQDVLALCGWSGLSYAEAALALGIPVGTVRSRLFSARKHLRELRLVTGHEEDDPTRVHEI
jgi:RNA polymerase sigma factor (sigma-70 family)